MLLGVLEGCGVLGSHSTRSLQAEMSRVEANCFAVHPPGNPEKTIGAPSTSTTLVLVLP